MNTYFKSFQNRAAYDAYTNTEDLFIAYIENTGDLIYVNDNPKTLPFTITALEDGAYVNLDECFWSTDGENWHSGGLQPADLNTGESIMLKTPRDGEIRHPSIDKHYAVGGNIMSLLYTDYYGSYLPSLSTPLKDFYKDNWNLVNAQNLILPKPGLRNGEDGCFEGMFWNCASLTHAPKLPATKLQKDCYQYMFAYCSSLVTPPELPATDVPEGAYMGMFQYCSSLATTPDLSKVKTVDGNGMLEMFNGSGIASVSDINLSYAKQGFIVFAPECTNLVDLGNTTISIEYNDQEARDNFNGCYNLEVAPHIEFTPYNTGLAVNLFAGCSSLNDASRIIIDTTNHTWNDSWGWGMFSGCSSLDHFEIYGPEWPNLHPEMFTDVASSGTFTVPAVTNYDPNDYIGNGIPSGWTIVRASN